MKVFIIVLFVVSFVLHLFGYVWVFIDRKNEERKKTPYLIIALSGFMMVVFFLMIP